MANNMSAVDQMERLIYDADGKFEEKFSAVKQGISTNLTAFSDRSYSLRQQVAHNTQLMSDEHFVEMMCDTEAHLAPEFTLKGDTDRRLYALLAGILKGLLRETVQLADSAARKIYIEMAWFWYLDKKKELLEYTIKKKEAARQKEEELAARKGAGSALGSRSGAAGQRGSFSAGDGSGHAQVLQVAVSASKVMGDAPAPQVMSSFQRMKQDAMELRHLAEASYARDGKEKEPGSTTTATSAKEREREREREQNREQREKDFIVMQPTQFAPQPLTYVEDAQAGKQSAAIRKTMRLYRKRNLAKADKLRTEIAAQQQNTSQPQASTAKVVMTAQAKARQEQQNQGSCRRIAGVCGSRSDRASVEERPKSTGPPVFLHHDSVAPTKRTPGERLDLVRAMANAQRHWVARQTQAVETAMEEREMSDMLTLYSFSHARLEEEGSRRQESDKYATQTGRTCHTILRRPQTAQQSRGGQQQSQVQTPLEEVTSMLGKVVYEQTEEGGVSLSPYDHYKPTPLDEQKLQAILRRVKTPDDGKDELLTKYGLSSTNGESLAATAALNKDLDVRMTPNTAVTPTVPESDRAIIELLFPALGIEEDVPSVARLKQLHMVERIRESFARYNSAVATKGEGGTPVHVPRAAIEKAILTPDDRPFQECIRLLPQPGSGFGRNYVNPGKDNKKDKKKKKKK